MFLLSIIIIIHNLIKKYQQLLGLNYFTTLSTRISSPWLNQRNSQWTEDNSTWRIRLTSSNKAIFSSLPATLRAKTNTAAVIPEPQVVVTISSPLLTFSQLSLPKTSSKTLTNSLAGKRVWYGGVVFVSDVRRVEKGILIEFGICPDDKPSRGSGAVPWNLNK